MKTDFILLYEKYRFSVKRYIHYLVQDKEVADDITQDVFFKLFIAMKKGNKKGSYNNQGFEKTFIYTIARNECLNYLNHKKQEKKYLREAFLIRPLNRTTIVDDLCNRELIDNVIKLIEVNKPSIFGTTYKLRVLEDLSYRGVARAMDDNIGTIKGRLNTCDEFLRSKGYVIDSKHKRQNKKKFRLKKRIIFLEELDEAPI